MVWSPYYCCVFRAALVQVRSAAECTPSHTAGIPVNIRPLPSGELACACHQCTCRRVSDIFCCSTACVCAAQKGVLHDNITLQCCSEVIQFPLCPCIWKASRFVQLNQRSAWSVSWSQHRVTIWWHQTDIIHKRQLWYFYVVFTSDT